MVATLKIADKLTKSIFDSARILIKQPLIGAIAENLIELKQGHRYLVVGNYKIVYRIIQQNIYITDIFDCRQNREKMKKRIE